jgi:hypothetical protein
MDENMKPGMGMEGMSGMEGEGESVPCIHLYSMPDGSYKVTQDEGPAPTEGQEAAGLDEAMELVRQMAEAGPVDKDEEAAMQAAESGYAKRATKSPDAPNPGGVFGE